MIPDPPCCLPGDPLDLVAQVMSAAAVSALPVVEDLATARLVGSITERDLIVKVVAVGLDPKSTTAEDVMTRAPLTCRAQDGLYKALATMAAHQVQQLPVVDDKGRLRGIIQAAAPGVSGGS
jgi:CBS domain-containing protein